jgi:hypothetical protein
MAIDHLVVRTPRRRQFVSHLADRFQLQALQGFRSGGKVLSEGVKFGNGPFLDVFDWPLHKPSFDPLVAVEANLAKAQEAAQAYGLESQLHRRDDFDPDQRPPWSILSFTRGQGLISSIFIIEYEDTPEAWQNDQFSGALYDRSPKNYRNVALEQIKFICSDTSASCAQLEGISGCSMPTFHYVRSENGNEGVASLHFRNADGELSSLHRSDFDQL